MLQQLPEPDSYHLHWAGDALAVSLTLDAPRRGRAVLRTEIGGAAVARRETIELNDLGRTPLERQWRDVPLAEAAPGVWRAEIPLGEVGVFRGKCCFFPEGADAPEWPEGGNFTVKVEPAETRGGNAVYTVFPRQFGSFRASSAPSAKSRAASTSSWGRWASTSSRPSPSSPSPRPTR